jgi:hypothetical protein
MTQEKNLLSFYQKQKKVKELKRLLPKFFSENRLDIQKLKLFLGSDTV